MVRMVAHNCAYVHVAFNGCRRAMEKGRRKCEGQRRQGGYVHVAVVVIVDGGGTATVASLSSRRRRCVVIGGDLRNSGARGKKRDDGLERGAAWCRSGGRVTRDDDGVNTPVISLKCTWVQPRAEALTIVAVR